VLAGVDNAETGSASGTLTAAQQVGNAIGVSVLGTIFFSVLDSRISEGPAAFRAAAFLALAAAAVLAAAAALVREVQAQGRQITQADLDGIRNICRCGTYVRLREAIIAGAKNM